MGIQEALVSSDPGKYFRPPYVGVRGWLGVYLDVEVDWTEIEDIVREAFLMIAPQKLTNQIEKAR